MFDVLTFSTLNSYCLTLVFETNNLQCLSFSLLSISRIVRILRGYARYANNGTRRSIYDRVGSNN